MESQITQKFIYLLQLGIGFHTKETISLNNEEWNLVYEMAIKQSLSGVVFEGVQRLAERDSDKKPPLKLLLEWIGEVEQIKQQNRLMDQRSAMLYRIFKGWGRNSCVLKGQGVARLYLQPELRQSGDIDIWVEGSRNEVVELLRNNYIGSTFIDYVNCHAGFFQDAEVEVHFRPTWFYNPFVNWKAQKWIKRNKGEQMSNYDKEVDFCYPTIVFNLVFSLIHIYRHVFLEGIGLRQLMDYYFILTHSNADERSEAFDTLKKLGLGKFTATVMHILRRVFDIDKKLLLCEPNVREGDFLLGEILRGGNFGYYDERNSFDSSDNRFIRGLFNVKRNFRYLKRYPSEVLWMPVWKVWHWGWRMSKGYL